MSKIEKIAENVQIHLDVGCEDISSETEVPLAVQDAVDNAKKDLKVIYDEEYEKVKAKHKVYCKELTANVTLGAHTSR